MTRKTKRSKTEMKVICQRLKKLIVDELGFMPEEISTKLKYGSTSTIYKVFNNEAFLDITRISKLAKLERDGHKPNIHWLFTGEGSPLIHKEKQNDKKDDLEEFNSVISRLSNFKKDALIKLLK